MKQEFRNPPENPQEPLMWIAGGNVNGIMVSLRMLGELLDPEEITNSLGSKPTKCYRKGDIHKGSRHDKIRETGLWLLQGQRKSNSSLGYEINSLMQKFTSDISVWSNFSSRFEVSLKCGLWLNKWNGGTDIEPQVLQLLGEKNILLDLDIYFEPQHE